MVEVTCEPGIALWERARPEDEFQTLTVVATSQDALLAPVRRLVDKATEAGFVARFAWHTFGAPLRGNTIERRSIEATFRQALDGYGEPHVGLVGSGGILTKTSPLLPPLRASHIEVIMRLEYGVVILARDATLTTERVHEAMEPFARGLDGGSYWSLLSEHRGWLLLRAYYDGCGQSVAQFVGTVWAIASLVQEDEVCPPRI